MKEGKLTNSDVTRNFIVLDKSVRDLFKPFLGSHVTIRDQDDCEFEFEVTHSIITSKKGKNRERLFLTQTKDFIDLLDLKEGDEIHFRRDVHNDKSGSFVVEIKENNTRSNVPSMDEQKRNKLIEVISETYKSVVNEYENIFNENRYLPTKEAQSSLVINGFTERNLTFNFCHNYLKQPFNLKQHPKTIVWQEIPIISVDREHVDSIVIDNDNNWVIYLEAKRLYDVRHFKSLLDDLKRIQNFHSDIPLPPNSPTNKVVVLLADHYYHGDGKKSKEKQCYDDFFTGKYVKKEALSEICAKDINLAKKLASKLKSARISTVCDDFQPITIIGEYNINIKDKIVYTIYCGAFFIE